MVAFLIPFGSDVQISKNKRISRPFFCDFNPHYPDKSDTYLSLRLKRDCFWMPVTNGVPTGILKHLMLND